MTPQKILSSAGSPTAAGRSPGRWLALLLVIALPIAALWPVCGHEFVSWDDIKTVQNNPTLDPVSLQSVKIWWTSSKMDLYVPVTYTVWGIIALFARKPATATTSASLNPVAFHTANLVLHALACVVVFQILRLLIGKAWPAAAGALVFGVHPVQVEAVAWVSGMKDVLGGLLALVAIWQYVVAASGRGEEGKSIRCPGAPGWRWHYAIATVAFALAMLAKPTEMVAPVIAGILDVLVVRRSWRQSAKWLWPWAVLSAACMVEAHWVQPVPGNSRNVAIWLRPMVAIATIGFYVRKLLVPIGFAVDYGLRPGLAVQSPWLVADAVFLGAAGVMLWVARRSSPLLAAGALVFVAALLPVLGFVTFDFQWYSTVADHYLYLPMLGVAMMSAWLAARWSGRAMAIGSAAVIALLGIGSVMQTRVWRNTRTLWVHTADVNPASGEAYHALAMQALKEGHPEDALDLSRQAIQNRPDDAWGYVSAGLALWRLDRLPEAAESYEKALEVDPTREAALEDLAGVLAQMKQFQAAEIFQRRVVTNNPASADQRAKLGWIFEQEHRKSAALAEYDRALQLDPANLTAREGRARLSGR